MRNFWKKFLPPLKKFICNIYRALKLNLKNYENLTVVEDKHYHDRFTRSTKKEKERKGEGEGVLYI